MDVDRLYASNARCHTLNHRDATRPQTSHRLSSNRIDNGPIPVDPQDCHGNLSAPTVKEPVPRPNRRHQQHSRCPAIDHRRAEPEGPLSSATRLGQELAANDSTTLRGSSLKNHLDERMTSKFVRFINHTSSHQREFSSGSMMFPKPGPSNHQKPVDSFRRNLPAKIRKEGPAKIIRQQVLGLQSFGNKSSDFNCGDC